GGRPPPPRCATRTGARCPSTSRGSPAMRGMRCGRVTTSPSSLPPRTARTGWSPSDSSTPSPRLAPRFRAAADRSRPPTRSQLPSPPLALTLSAHRDREAPRAHVRRRAFLAGSIAATTLAAAPRANAQKRGGTLRFVPHADLKVLDPIWTTAYITRNHGYLVYDTLFATD